MKNRIFIAINLPLEIKRQLLIYQQEIDDLFEMSPIRWTKKENLHITLFFIGQTGKEKLKEVEKIVQEISLRKLFSIELFKIVYGPFGDYDFESKEIPKMVWVNLKYLKEFFLLQKDLEQKLQNQNIIQDNLVKNKFSAHITLGRINQWQWKIIEPNERPTINKDISLFFPVNSIEIMNSKLSFKSAEHSIYKSFALQEPSNFY